MRITTTTNKPHQTNTMKSTTINIDTTKSSVRTIELDGVTITVTVKQDFLKEGVDFYVVNNNRIKIYRVISKETYLNEMNRRKMTVNSIHLNSNNLVYTQDHNGKFGYSSRPHLEKSIESYSGYYKTSEEAVNHIHKNIERSLNRNLQSLKHNEWVRNRMNR